MENRGKRRKIVKIIKYKRHNYCDQKKGNKNTRRATAISDREREREKKEK
jgi:hypothetical protein